jgi:serine/threonine protein kinase
VRLEPGMQVGPYRIGSPIGAGGMGRVYKAHDSRLGRDVAIKVLREDVAEHPGRRSRLEIEARAVAALNHPHICTLHDVGPNYLVMEYIEGESLAARIRKGPIPIDQALRIAIESASALEAAHRHGIIHRDLKPGNIMLTDSGTKLLDFGLAKFQDVRVTGEESMAMTDTRSEQLIGTLPYMSPEQLEGEHADARSYIFSFGAILYEMVAGKRAFDRNSTSGIVNAICREQPRPLRDFIANVPPDLQRIIYRCLRKSCEERYSSASDVLRELEECRSLASEPVSGINFKVLLRQSKRPRVAIPTLLAIVLLGSLLGWWIWRGTKARWARTEALPKISQLIEQEKLGEAYALAVEAERYVPDDAQLRNFWPKISWFASIHSTPPGATVYQRSFGAQNGIWALVGRSPIEKYRLPLNEMPNLRIRFRIEAAMRISAIASRSHCCSGGKPIR